MLKKNTEMLPLEKYINIGPKQCLACRVHVIIPFFIRIPKQVKIDSKPKNINN